MSFDQRARDACGLFAGFGAFFTVIFPLTARIVSFATRLGGFSARDRAQYPMTTSVLIFRLRKHADYQRVYKAGRKQFARQMTYFFTLRPELGPDGSSLRDVDAGCPRIGLTVGKVMGKAVDRNRIKRRMREAVRKNIS